MERIVHSVYRQASFIAFYLFLTSIYTFFIAREDFYFWLALYIFILVGFIVMKKLGWKSKYYNVVDEKGYYSYEGDKLEFFYTWEQLRFEKVWVGLAIKIYPPVTDEAKTIEHIYWPVIGIYDYVFKYIPHDHQDFKVLEDFAKYRKLFC